ncbi:hypothetical protein CPAR01_06766 [Colletotrichum paranaense]|uniref:Uncharacterized protein n=1 Tax=Colletotrichum paranaense TaxID=1914294 RepID=A0ABQ9SMN6_9PEZI|nr:uncharacterized protein CPAR01_06766 [Colletotrichum paranaense]KAK1540777.1 hypothetical protein CPAR01_06766 [Colletotrichum paranaense]
MEGTGCGLLLLLLLLGRCAAIYSQGTDMAGVIGLSQPWPMRFTERRRLSSGSCIMLTLSQKEPPLAGGVVVSAAEPLRGEPARWQRLADRSVNFSRIAVMQIGSEEGISMSAGLTDSPGCLITRPLILQERHASVGS